MYLNFHTHFASKSSNSENIFNVIVETDTIRDISWMKMESVSLGIHPWYIKKESLALCLDFLRENVARPNVKFIGEAGLDKVKGADWAIQKDVFLQQIQIAEDIRKPMVIHCVRAFNELVSLKIARKPKVPMVVHGFVKKLSLAQELIGHGFKLSFGSDLLSNPQVKEVFIETPIESLFLETDDCEYLEIERIYEEAAFIKKMNVEDLKREIYRNYLELYL